MKSFVLQREPSTGLATEGLLTFGDVSIHTIERPWIPTHPGGKPFESCVPAGRYKLRKHTRGNGDKVLALVNPGLGVYYRGKERINDVGRYLILIHAGNWVTDVVGCIAPGIGSAVTDGGPMVTDSRKAMKLIMSWADEYTDIVIHDAP